MKKLLALLMTLLVAAVPALAEGAPFSFRNGVTWDMTQAELLALEDGEPEVIGRDLYLDAVDEAGLPVILHYSLLNDHLVFANYVYDAVDPDDLAAQYTERYGAPVTPDMDRLARGVLVLMGSEDEASARAELEAFDIACAWELPGTYIAILTEADTDYAVALFIGEDALQRQLDGAN